MQCAIINRQICQRLNSPTTQNTMSQIIDHYISQILTKHNSNDSQKSATQYENKVSNIVKSVMKIQKYKWMKNMPKFNEYVKQLNPFNSEIFQFFALIYNKIGGTYVTLPSQVLIQYLKLSRMHGCVYI